MGGSGGGTFQDYKPEKLKERIRQAEERATDADFDNELSGALSSLLAQYNDRDIDLINKRLSEITNNIENDLEGRIDVLFGGSVAKHTYVDGLSDIDSLLIFNNTKIASDDPASLLQYAEDKLKNSIDANILVGQLAITVEYEDGMVIQLLPALKTEKELKVPSWSANQWSKINPDTFRDALTRRNEQCGNKLIPMIKLAKAINSSLPEESQLSGYHIESLAISAFRSYKGTKTVIKMLPHFFEQAKILVMEPITDKSGQSINVDEYLGVKNSEARTNISHILNRISKRMKNANASKSIEKWLAIIE